MAEVLLVEPLHEYTLRFRSVKALYREKGLCVSNRNQGAFCDFVPELGSRQHAEGFVDGLVREGPVGNLDYVVSRSAALGLMPATAHIAAFMVQADFSLRARKGEPGFMCEG